MVGRATRWCARDPSRLVRLQHLSVPTLSYWFGFVGAWLLVAGQVYKAGVELRAEGEVTARVQEMMQGAPQPPKVSSWWWLLPPARFLLGSQRRGDFRRAFLASPSAEDLDMVTRYMDIARGWMLVGFGAFLIPSPGVRAGIVSSSASSTSAA
jgi:hypothetical protein